MYTKYFIPCFILLLTIGSGVLLFAQDIPHAVVAKPESEAKALIGRWDLQVKQGDDLFPSWLEVEQSGFRTLVGRFVGTGGSARPIAKINFDNGKFSFSIPPQWESGDNDLSFEGSLQNNTLTGSISYLDGKKYNYTAVRAPSLQRPMTPAWGKPVRIFNGKDLKGWRALGQNQWVVENGILRSPKSGSNLVTEASFSNFKLHIEFRYPKGSNSGVYLRGRYEVQISDSKGLTPSRDQLGAVYGFITPTEMVAKDPGEWQSYDITLVGRMITLVANGKTIICNQEIPGITGGAIDSKEDTPGPLLIQGDHGPVEFRNILITTAK